MIKTVLFDLDDTLFDFQAAEHRAIRNTFADLGLEPTDSLISRYSEINLSRWKLLEQGVLTRKEVINSRFEILFSELGKNILPEDANKVYWDYLSQGYDYIDGAEELLIKIYKKYDLYAVSNGSTVVQKRRIRGTGVDRFFKDIFISEIIGYDKPSIEFFNACFSKIDGFKKEEAIIIGDSLSADIKGGKNAGVKTCWFNPRGKEGEADFIIRSLKEIPNLLERI